MTYEQFKNIDCWEQKPMLIEAMKKMPDGENKRLAKKYLSNIEFCATLKRCTFHCVKNYLPKLKTLKIKVG